MTYPRVSPRSALRPLLVPFKLTASDSRQIRLWDYRQRRNLVLFFHHGLSCTRCRAELARFDRHYSAYRERDAEVLAIGPDDSLKHAALVASLGLQFPLLSDPNAAAADRQGVDLPAVVVADRYEQIWAAWSPPDELDLPSQEEIVGWLEFISIQCHRRGAPVEWQPRRGIKPSRRTAEGEVAEPDRRIDGAESG